MEKENTPKKWEKEKRSEHKIVHDIDIGLLYEVLLQSTPIHNKFGWQKAQTCLSQTVTNLSYKQNERTSTKKMKMAAPTSHSHTSIYTDVYQITKTTLHEADNTNTRRCKIIKLFL
jgi:hypothetical protein